MGAESYAARLTLEAKKDVTVGKSEMMSSLDKLIRIIGILLIIFCITFTIIGWISQRTEISGTDQVDEVQEKGRRKAETEEQYDDYGQSNEY